MIKKKINGQLQDFASLGGTQYESLPAASGGTDLSLVTTGDKYDWDANTEAVEAIVNEYGAKNLLPVTLSNLKANNTDGTWSGNTYTYRDVTYTCTTSGDIVTSITMNGTANSAGDSLISIPMACHAGKWLANGGTADSSSTTYGAFVDISTGGYSYVYDEDVEINLNSDTTISYIIYTRTGQTCSNVTFYPMLRDARITDSTYVPYAMTNAELTDKVSVTSGTTNNPDVTWKRFGNVVVVSVVGATYGMALTGLPTPATYAISFVCVSATSNIGGYIQVVPAGTNNLNITTGPVYGSLTYICEG